MPAEVEIKDSKLGSYMIQVSDVSKTEPRNYSTRSLSSSSLDIIKFSNFIDKERFQRILGDEGPTFTDPQPSPAIKVFVKKATSKENMQTPNINNAHLLVDEYCMPHVSTIYGPKCGPRN